MTVLGRTRARTCQTRSHFTSVTNPRRLRPRERLFNRARYAELVRRDSSTPWLVLPARKLRICRVDRAELFYAIKDSRRLGYPYLLRGKTLS
jgi:hypothetical protein